MQIGKYIGMIAAPFAKMAQFAPLRKEAGRCPLKAFFLLQPEATVFPASKHAAPLF